MARQIRATGVLLDCVECAPISCRVLELVPGGMQSFSEWERRRGYAKVASYAHVAAATGSRYVGLSQPLTPECSARRRDFIGCGNITANISEVVEVAAELLEWSDAKHVKKRR